MTESLTATVLEQHGAFVTRLARALASDPHEALDLEQETWLASLRGAPPAGERSPRRWLADLMRGRAFSARRAARRRRAREHARARREAIDPAAEVEAGSHVVQAVLALDEPYRATLLLRRPVPNASPLMLSFLTATM